MTQNPNEQKQNIGEQKKTCEVCHQTFNSDRELQEHMQNAHLQRRQSEGQTGSDRTSKDPGKDYSGQDQPKRDKIA
jgi:hypothetical protein